MEKKSKFEILGEFVGHLLLGAAMWVALALVSGALNFFSHWYSGVVGSELGGLLKLAEQGMLYADMVFMAWWVTFSTVKAIKDL